MTIEIPKFFLSRLEKLIKATLDMDLVLLDFEEGAWHNRVMIESYSNNNIEACLTEAELLATQGQYNNAVDIILAVYIRSEGFPKSKIQKMIAKIAETAICSDAFEPVTRYAKISGLPFTKEELLENGLKLVDLHAVTGNFRHLEEGLAMLREGDVDVYQRTRIAFGQDRYPARTKNFVPSDARIVIHPVPDEDKFLGVIFGQVVGDILGGPLEFMTRDEIRMQYGTVRDYMPGGAHQLQKGETTDDSQTMKAVLESIVENRRFSGKDILERLIKWINSGPKDIGRLTKAVLARYDANRKKYASGRKYQTPSKELWKKNSRQSAGNGSIMRCSPLALINHWHSPKLAFESAECSKITHYDPICQVGCYILNYAATELMKTNHVNLEVLKQESFLNQKEILTEALDYINTPFDPASPGKGYALDTLKTAFWALASDTFEEGIVSVANLGQDADTNAAVAGVLLGAKHGFSNIPARWIQGMMPADRMDFEVLGKKLHALARENSTKLSNDMLPLQTQ